MADYQRICSVDGCGKRHAAKGYCPTHLARFKKHGSPHVVLDRKKPDQGCKVDGCNDPHHAKGYCARHRAKLAVYGTPLGGRDGTRPGEPLQWIKDNCNHQGDDCLPWPFEVTDYGYGTVRHKGRKRVASRVMCEFAHGAAPDHMDAAHRCHNPICCNPKHLKWATRSENNIDMFDNGTAMCGERVEWWVKLKEEDVRAIRSRAASGEMLKDIARDYPVNASQISRIVSRVRWGWLD